MQFDLQEFNAAFDLVITTTQRAAAPYLRKKALGVLIGTKGHQGAVQITPRASRSKIMAVDPKILGGQVIAREKAKGNWPLDKFQIDTLVHKERMRRIASIGYTAGPGWNNAILALGGSGVGRSVGTIQQGFNRSKAADGTATVPTSFYLASVIENHAPAADLIGRDALQQGIYNQAQDMNEYGAAELLKPIFMRSSAK